MIHAELDNRLLIWKLYFYRRGARCAKTGRGQTYPKASAEFTQVSLAQCNLVLHWVTSAAEVFQSFLNVVAQSTAHAANNI